MDLEKQLEDIQIMETQNLRRREAFLHTKLEALRWVRVYMLQHLYCQNFETDYKNVIAMLKKFQI